MADIEALRFGLQRLGKVIVAFSGGADSSFLAWMAHDTLGFDNCIVVTAVSDSLADEELDACREFTTSWEMNFIEVKTHELLNPLYVANQSDRCYYCKTELMDAIEPIAISNSSKVTLGVNLDDLGEHRPGQLAAKQRGASFPLVEAGFTKHDVRKFSQSFGLKTWDKPASACLASRIPYGIDVDINSLKMINRAESSLRSFGFSQLRVRHYGDLARIEVPLEDLPKAIELRQEMVLAIKQAGYSYVTLDLEGFRSGNLNQALAGN